MSISLPNGTFIPAPSATGPVTAAVTRILHLTNFSPELKTRDLQIMFKEWETEKGGFRIKWVDDTNALVVFGDANIAKRAYLYLLLHPPTIFPPPAQIRPYDGPDAAQIIAALSARAMGHRSAASGLQSISNMAFGQSGSSISGISASLGMNGHSNQPLHINGNGNGNHNVNVQNNGNHEPKPIQSSAPVGGGMGNFVMPTKRSGNLNGVVGIARANQHTRIGSGSASWARQSMSGALSFPSSASGRLPTHNERVGKEEAPSSGNVSRSVSSSSEEDPILMLGPQQHIKTTAPGVGRSWTAPRRDSVSADKALMEIRRALDSVEAV